VRLKNVTNTNSIKQQVCSWWERILYGNLYGTDIVFKASNLPFILYFKFIMQIKPLIIIISLGKYY